MTAVVVEMVEPSPALGQIHDAIRSAGGRLSAPTRALVAVLLETDDHLTAEDLCREVERRIPGVAPSTVYRVLQRLAELGIVGHVHSGVGPAFHHLRHRGHAHLVCRQCGVVVDMPDSAFAQLARESRLAHGFRIDPYRSALLGRCGRCASGRTATVPRAARGPA